MMVKRFLKFFIPFTVAGTASGYVLVPRPDFPQHYEDVGSFVTRVPNSVQAIVYYPCKPNNQRRSYLPIDVCAVFTHRFIIPFFHMEHFPDITQHEATPIPSTEDKKYPVIIFSHGLAGSMTIYSTKCAALAQKGFVVCALEHEDGSAMCATQESGERIAYKDAEDWHDLVNREKQLDIRKPQFEKRCATIHQTIESLPKIIQGDLTDMVDLNNIFLVGHSMGGATHIKYMHDEGKENEKIKKVVCWDCWSMALSEEILDNPNLGDVDCLHIESDEFIHDKHFTHIHHFTENLFNNIKNSTSIFIPRMNHLDFSDVCYWWPQRFGPFFGVSGFDNVKCGETLVDLTIKFLRNEEFDKKSEKENTNEPPEFVIMPKPASLLNIQRESEYTNHKTFFYIYYDVRDFFFGSSH